MGNCAPRSGRVREEDDKAVLEAVRPSKRGSSARDVVSSTGGETPQGAAAAVALQPSPVSHHEPTPDLVEASVADAGSGGSGKSKGKKKSKGKPKREVVAWQVGGADVEIVSNRSSDEDDGQFP